MNELDENLARLFAREAPDLGGEQAFAAAVRQRIARERRKAKVLALCAGGAAVLGVAALVALAPEAAFYPAQTVHRWVTSPVGVAAGVLAAVSLTWWSRYGEI